MLICPLRFFFFSSRRRHTRFDCDWSSDVCSSDLGLTADPRRAVAKLSFYGGVGGIGGNKILVEDRDARIWLDMGAPFHLGEEYFVEFLQPRDPFGPRGYVALDPRKRVPRRDSSEAL